MVVRLACMSMFLVVPLGRLCERTTKIATRPGDRDGPNASSLLSPYLEEGFHPTPRTNCWTANYFCIAVLDQASSSTLSSLQDD
jgi:hypothetical protein